jgi:hypothetical protein
MSQKSADLFNVAAKAWNQGYVFGCLGLWGATYWVFWGSGMRHIQLSGSSVLQRSELPEALMYNILSCVALNHSHTLHRTLSPGSPIQVSAALSVYV